MVLHMGSLLNENMALNLFNFTLSFHQEHAPVLTESGGSDGDDGLGFPF